MKISFITTVLNEAKTIQALLDSIQTQTKKPEEVIIVDAGSADQTCRLIKAHPLKNKLSLRLIQKAGLNRSQARNLAVSQAKHGIIAVSDAGCWLDPDWLKRLTEPFQNSSVGAVAGYYQPETKTVFQTCISPFVAVMADRLNPKTYLPSSRSLAFRKSAWALAGRYPEKLNYCEDLVFASELKLKTNLAVRPDAIVYWSMVKNLPQFYTQIFHYASGDIQARYRPHLKKIISVFIRYLVFAGLPPLFLLYLLVPVIKHYHHVNHPLAIFYLPLLQITSDIGIMLGSLYGLFKSSH